MPMLKQIKSMSNIQLNLIETPKNSNTILNLPLQSVKQVLSVQEKICSSIIETQLSENLKNILIASFGRRGGSKLLYLSRR